MQRLTKRSSADKHISINLDPVSTEAGFFIMRPSFLIFIAALLLSSCSFDAKKLFGGPERPASFPGGQASLTDYLSKNLAYPEYAIENEIQGRVYVRFIIDKNGFVKNPVIMKGVHPALDREAMRVVSTMPRWVPGTNRGKRGDSYFNLPITFKLE
jgi:TonB family protein